MLKPTRITSHGNDDVRCTMNEVAEEGIVVVWDTSSTGHLGGLDDPYGVVKVPTTGAGNVPVGVLMNNVVNLDLTRTHLNAHKDEVQVRGKVAIMKHGQVHTNMLKTGDSPVPGDTAYYTVDGKFTKTTVGGSSVGKFVSAPDADGYVVVDIRL